ncbi:uncharacterized protein BX664DRAFT_290634 [Halteromyces radiatus]|uniref:uncharacterized protein n=1 Tax=Halteromyces radiatus TaxID=101107 RepID=UPI0022212046|nr:uncharacterized protein BX664DRAFT_290634 [Halteromyces radiatus]KAI8100101.1 hypothetical protein BX664DRAFT_290634 [Halteromyces radiatus]
MGGGSGSGGGTYSSATTSSSYSTTPTNHTSPYSTSSSPGYHSPNVSKSHYNPPLKKYVLQPPAKLLPYSKSMPSMGYPGMFPQRINQEEDILTESNVRSGFVDKPAVSNEQTCAHDIIFGKLQDDQRLLNEMGGFMVEVLKRKRKAARITGTPSFKPPTRTALMESKKEQWIQELANGAVPLRKLSRNVPHGYKGEKLLETLAARQVPFLRATWYIKVVGLSEMAQRNVSNAGSNTSHAYNWTVIVTGHLKKQLADLIPLSSNSTTGSMRGYRNSNVPGVSGTAMGGGGSNDNQVKPWATPETKARFESRWAYSTKLARWQYCEGLLDQRNFLKWSLDTLASSNSFEIMWLVLTGLVQDYVDEYRRNRTLTKLLIETLIKAYSAVLQCSKLNNSISTPTTTTANPINVFTGLKRDIERTLQSLFLSSPDMFVIPKLYHQYRPLFEMILGEQSRLKVSKTMPDICKVMESYWEMMKARNEIFYTPRSSVKGSINSTSERSGVDEERIVHTLDSIGRYADSGHLLLGNSNNIAWADMKGHSSVTATAAIFSGCINASTGNIQKQPLNQVIQILFLDDQMVDQLPLNTPASFLYDTFVRMQLFSYHRYLNRLTARGLLEQSQRKQPNAVRCLHHLKSLPLLHPVPAHLVNQRRVALYGSRREGGDYESRLETKAIEQLQYLAKQWIMGTRTTIESTLNGNQSGLTLFGKNAEDMTEPMANDTPDAFDLSLSDKFEQQMQQLMDGSTRYVIIQFTSEWLVNEVKRFVVKNVQIGEDNWRVMTSPGSCLLNARQYVALIKILECAKDYMNIVQVAVWVLEKTNEKSVLQLVIDTLRRYANIWKLMNLGKLVTQTLWNKHQSLQTRGTRERCVMIYMVQLVQEGHMISDDMRLQLQKDLQMRPKVRGSRRTPVSMTEELQQVINSNGSKTSIQNVVESLCVSYQYQNAALWIGLVLDGTVSVIQQWNKKTTMYGGSHQSVQQQQQQMTLQRFLCAYADIIKDIVDQCTLTGEINDALVDWLSNKVTVVEELRQPQSWMALFICLLASRGLVSLESLFYRFTLPWFDQVSQHFIQDDVFDNTNNGNNNQQWLQVFENMMVLIRLLVVQERCYWVQQEEDTVMDDTSGTYQQPWVLQAEEVFRLETLRHTQLACSLDRIEPMFALMEKLVLIASSLPLSSPLLQELVILRADLLQIGWFRQACVRDLHGVYQRFSSHGTEASTEKKVKKKMLSIVDELIGGTLADIGHHHHHHHHHHHLHHAALVQEPDFIDKIRRIFVNVSQWNEEQCRVQVSLLLDNILLSDGGNGQDPNNPHILGGDDITMNANDKQQGNDDGLLINDRTANKELDAFVRFFFNIVLSDEGQHQRRSLFFKNIIHGLRERVLLELLNYGVRLLEGSTSTPSPVHSSSVAPFPNNILLLSSVDECFDSDKYKYKSRAFFNIMQHMMAQNIWGNNKKIALVKTLHQQIKRFQSGLLIYQVMQDAHTTFARAVAALDLTKNNVDAAVALLTTEGLISEPTDSSITLHDLRTSLLIRMRLVVPFASLIWEYPKEDECDALSWIRILVILLGNPIVHGNGSQEQFFEFVLDFVSLIIDEVPKELRKPTLSLLSTLHHHGELSTIPVMFQSRVNRILPFSTHNIYLTNSRLATGILGATTTTDPLQQQQHLETCMEQSRPWEWLEDYVSDPPHDNDVPINLGLFRARKSRRVDGTYIRCRT